MAALNVYVQVGRVADSIFLATDVLPSLWQFSLGPLLDLAQFQAFMGLIKSLSIRIEQEQIRKLQDLTSNGSSNSRMTGQRGQQNGGSFNEGETGDFESLVTGRKTGVEIPNVSDNEWSIQPAIQPSLSQGLSQRQKNSDAPAFAWSSTPISAPLANQPTVQRLQPANSRAVTPDVGSLSSVTPANRVHSSFAQPLQPLQPLQPQRSMASGMVPLQPQPPTMHSMGVLQPQQPNMQSIGVLQPQQSSIGMSTMQPMIPSQTAGTSINWSAATVPKDNWTSMSSGNNGFGATSAAPTTNNLFRIPPPVTSQGAGGNTSGQSGAVAGSKQGLDKYESLL